MDGTWTELPNCVRMPVTCKLPPIDNKDVVYEEFNLTQGKADRRLQHIALLQYAAGNLNYGIEICW